jgi:flagellar protein FliL
MGIVLGLAIVTVIAAAGGIGLVFALPDASAPGAAPPGAHRAEKETDAHGGGKGHEESEKSSSAAAAPATASFKVWSVSPLTTNLHGLKAPWIRLEGALVYEAAIERDMPEIASRITEDFLAFLRSVKPEQVRSRSGFRTLMEDLNERAKLRSGGKVAQFVVSAFIIE